MDVLGQLQQDTRLKDMTPKASAETGDSDDQSQGPSGSENVNVNNYTPGKSFEKFDAVDVPQSVLIRENTQQVKNSMLDAVKEDEEEVNHSENSSLLEKLQEKDTNDKLIMMVKTIKAHGVDASFKEMRYTKYEMSGLDDNLDNSFSRLSLGIVLHKYHYNKPQVDQVVVRLSPNWKAITWQKIKKRRSRIRSLIFRKMAGIALGPETATFKFFKPKVDAKGKWHDDDQWISLINRQRSLDLASTCQQDLFDIWKGVSYLTHVYSKHKIMHLGTRHQFVIKIVKIKIQQMVRETGVTINELFLLAILKVCISRDMDFGKKRICNMIEKRTFPAYLFYRIFMGARAQNRKKVYVLATRKEKFRYFEEIRKEILMARRFCKLQGLEEKFYETKDLQSRTKKELLQMSSKASLQRSIAKNMIIQDKTKTIASTYVKRQKKRSSTVGPLTENVKNGVKESLYSSLDFKRVEKKRISV